MKKLSVKNLTLAAVVAALYTVLSLFGNVFGLTYGPIQCRFAEALCVLPFFFPETAWGLFVGCILTNLMSMYGPLDIVFGSLATLAAALWTAKMKKRFPATLPPVILNGVVVSAVIAWSEAGASSAFFSLWVYNAATIALGEALACCVLGLLLLYAIPRIGFFRELIEDKSRL